MIYIGDKVKVVNLKKEEMMNLWGGYDDITIFSDKIATVVDVYDRDEIYEKYALEFEHFGAQITRERTGYVFGKEEIELIVTE